MAGCSRNITERGVQGCLHDWTQWFTARGTLSSWLGCHKKSTEGEGEPLVHLGHAVSMARTPCLASASARFSVTEMTLNHAVPTGINKGPDQQVTILVSFSWRANIGNISSNQRLLAYFLISHGKVFSDKFHHFHRCPASTLGSDNRSIVTH